MKVKKGDEVKVIAGKDKGSKGKVIAAFPDSNRVIVEGVGRMTKHVQESTDQRGAKVGGIVTQEAPIHVSNVMVLDDGGQPTRVGYRTERSDRRSDKGPESDTASGKRRRVRIARSTGKDL